MAKVDAKDWLNDETENGLIDMERAGPGKIGIATLLHHRVDQQNMLEDVQ